MSLNDEGTSSNRKRRFSIRRRTVPIALGPLGTFRIAPEVEHESKYTSYGLGLIEVGEPPVKHTLDLQLSRGTCRHLSAAALVYGKSAVRSDCPERSMVCSLILLTGPELHGLIVNQLRNYTVTRHGNDAWITAVERSGAQLPAGTPPLAETYPDSVVVGVIVEVASVANLEVQDLLHDFGEYLAAGLLRVYEPLVRPEWKTLDVIQNVEQQIHTVVRMRDPNAGPPYLTARRVSPTEVDVVYGSERHLCSLAEGIVRGLATHYHEQVSIRQPECMLRGDARCLIKIELVTG